MHFLVTADRCECATEAGNAQSGNDHSKFVREDTTEDVGGADHECPNGLEEEAADDDQGEELVLAVRGPLDDLGDKKAGG